MMAHYDVLSTRLRLKRGKLQTNYYFYSQTYCSNLEVLDISGTLAASHPAAVPLEALQKGCPKMRVFRAANSQLVLANATTSQQVCYKIYIKTVVLMS